MDLRNTDRSFFRKKIILEVVRKSKPLPPTIRDLQKATGITSTSVVNYYLDILEKEGKIRRVRGEDGRSLARGIVVVE